MAIGRGRYHPVFLSTPRDDWIDRARDHKIEHVLAQRGILGTLKGRNRQLAGPCPVCGGRDRFGVDLRRGLFNCRQCQRGGRGAISLVCFLDNCDFLRAVEILVGPPPSGKGETEDERREREQRAIERRERLAREQHQRDMREAAELQKALRYCDVLWREAVAPLPSVAISYFAERRGIDINAVPEQGGLRFLSNCPFDGEVKPCILARFTDPVTNEPSGIWRRPISGEKPKCIGPVRRQVIKLWADEYVEQGLLIGEGPESVLAAATRITHRETLLQPAWACGCADSLRNFPILPGIEFLTILADNDANSAGQDAARDCADRLADAGREAEVLTPTKLGADFNDIVVRGLL